MKKLISLLLALSMLFVFTACSSTESADQSADQAASDTQSAQSGQETDSDDSLPEIEAQYISFGTDAGSGSYTMTASAVASVLGDYLPQVSINLETTSGGGTGNIRKLGNNEIELGIGTSSSAYEATNGTGDFEGEEYDNVRILLAGAATPVHAWVPDDSKLQSVSDLKGARVGVNSAANASTYAPTYLKAHGLNEGDYEIVQMAAANLSDALKDGSIDCIVTTAAVPYSTITELASTGSGGRFLKSDPEALRKVADESPYWVSYVIPANTYEGQTEDVESIAVMANIYTSAEVDDDLTYMLTKMIIEHSDEIGAIYEGAKFFTLDNQKEFFADGIDNATPALAEGTKRYLTEQGLD